MIIEFEYPLNNNSRLMTEILTNELNNEEIDLHEILEFFLRNKFLIAKLAFIGTLIGVAVALSIKRTWKGEFQIVIDQNKNKESSLVNQLAKNPKVGNFASTLGLGGKNNLLETEVEILRSPSVLFPIYEYVKNKKNELKEPFVGSYDMWFKQFTSVSLKKGTSVLTFTYTDQNKDIILPTLKLISEKYQSYSGQEKKRKLNIGVKYLEEQIKKYSAITLNSEKKIQDFGYLHNLIVEFKKESIQPIIVSEIKRKEAISKLQKVEKILEQVKGLPLDEQLYEFGNIYYRGSESDSLNVKNITPFKMYQEINEKIAFKKNIFKNSDPEVIKLNLTKQKIIKEIKIKLLDNLKAEKEFLNIIIDSNTKSKEIIIEYNELLRNSLQNRQLLSTLQTNLLRLRLENAKTEDPWKLITTPTLGDFPIAPKRKIITLITFLISVLAAIILGIFKENKNDLIYTKKEFKKFIKMKFIEEINLKNKENFEEILKLLTQSNLYIPEGEILALIPIGDIDKDLLGLFTSNLEKFMIKNEIRIFTKLSEAKECYSQIFLVSNGVTKKYQIRNLENLLKIQGNETLGWILLSNN